MKSRLALAALGFAVGWVWALPLEIDESREIRARELLNAPTIVIGRSDSLVAKGTVWIKRTKPVQANVLESSVQVQVTLKGPALGAHFQLTNMLSGVADSQNLGWQLPDPAVTYVFFLRPGTGGVLEPVSPFQFVLALEKVPDVAKGSVLENINFIAKENIDATNSLVSRDWALFLSGIFDPVTDRAFWTNKFRDPRLGIRAIALQVVAENMPSAPGIQAEVLEFLNETASNRLMSSQRAALAEALPTIGTKNVSDENLQAWFTNKSTEAQKAGLTTAANLRKTSVTSDIVQLMERSENKEVQYECIKALSVLKGGQLMAIREFLKQPDVYIREWKDFAIQK